MGLITSLFGGGASTPTYDVNAAKDMFQWQQGQARYGVNNGLSSLTWDPNSNTQQISYTPAMQSIINNMLSGDASAKRAEESVFSAFQDRYAPIFERQTSQLSDSLKNKGIPIGSEAYARAMETNAQNQNDAILAAANQATLTGQQRANQTLANNASIFSLFNPLNSYQPGAGTPNIDIYGNQYQSQMNAYNAKANANQNAWGTLFGAAFSDARIKENLRAVAVMPNGITVYAFNFPGSPTQLGVVAQEVQEIMPEAVTQGPEGLLMVDYDMITQFAGDEGQDDSREDM